MYPSEVLDKVLVRMPEGMRPQLKARAALNRRTMNAEIVLMLEQALSSAAAATGEGLGNHAPAAAPDSAALQGGSIHQRS